MKRILPLFLRGKATFSVLLLVALFTVFFSLVYEIHARADALSQLKAQTRRDILTTETSLKFQGYMKAQPMLLTDIENLIPSLKDADPLPDYVQAVAEDSFGSDAKLVIGQVPRSAAQETNIVSVPFTIQGPAHAENIQKAITDLYEIPFLIVVIGIKISNIHPGDGSGIAILSGKFFVRQ